MPPVLDAVRRYIGERAEAAARPPDEYPGVLPWAPDIELLGITDEYGETTAWFAADFMIRYGGQAGSDWYLHVIEVGRAVIASDGALLEAVVEQRSVEHVSEWAWEHAPPDRRYDRAKARDAVIAGWWPPLSAMP